MRQGLLRRVQIVPVAALHCGEVIVDVYAYQLRLDPESEPENSS